MTKQSDAQQKTEFDSDIWSSCKLGRKDEATKLERYISRVHEDKLSLREGGHTLNIDAKWGEGKTHFITLWRKQLEKNHLVIFLNAWKTDFTGDPLLALFSAINEATDNFIKKSKLEGVAQSSVKLYKVLSNYASKTVFKQSRKEMHDVSDTSGEKLLQDFNNQRKIIDEIQGCLKNLVDAIGSDKNNTHYTPIYVLIDELDRCRPLYAISLLERIKHIFNVRGVQFVIVTDTEQLSHTVKSVYGDRFASHTYLKRFFDVQYHFPEVDGAKHTDLLFNQSKIKKYLYVPLEEEKIHETIFCDFSIRFNWSMRDRIQVFERLSLLAQMIFDEGSLHLVPMLFYLGLKQKLTNSQYDEICSSNEVVKKLKMEKDSLEYSFKESNFSYNSKHRNTPKNHWESVTVGLWDLIVIYEKYKKHHTSMCLETIDFEQVNYSHECKLLEELHRLYSSFSETIEIQRYSELVTNMGVLLRDWQTK